MIKDGVALGGNQKFDPSNAMSCRLSPYSTNLYFILLHVMKFDKRKSMSYNPRDFSHLEPFFQFIKIHTGSVICPSFVKNMFFINYLYFVDNYIVTFNNERLFF